MVLAHKGQGQCVGYSIPGAADQLAQQKLAKGPIAKVGIGVDVAHPPGIRKATPPLARECLDASKTHVMIIMAAHEDGRER